MRCRHANFVIRYRHGESKARLMRASDLKVQKKRRESEGRDSDGREKKIMERKKRHREKESGNCERWIK